jgi:hypothetical protein
MTETQSPQNPMLRVMSLRDFRLLFGGSTTSLMGDRFALIDPPWLVLQLTGDPLGLGIVLAMMSILMFSGIGLVLISQAITGAVSKWDLNVLFVSAGILAMLLLLWMVFQPSFKICSDNLASQRTGEGGLRISSLSNS